MPITDYVLGFLLGVALLYVFYLVDRKFVYRKEKLGFWSHITKTGFFPKRMVAYLLIWLVVLIGLVAIKPSLTPNTLTYSFLESIFRLSIYPFFALCAIVLIVTFKIAIFPSQEDR